MTNNYKQILGQILSYEAKKYDASCSADTHLNQAIYLLFKENTYTSGFTTENIERIEKALEEMELLGVVNQEY
jgi:hypothetical protein